MSKGLDQIMASLRAARPQAKPQTVLHRQDGPRPLLELIREDAALPKALPKTESVYAKEQTPKAQERIALHNAQAKARAGHRLTHKEKAVIGKHGLAVILAQLKAKGVSDD